MTLSQELMALARDGSAKMATDLINAAYRAKDLEDGLWRARAALDNAHREILPHVNKLIADAIEVAAVVDPPLRKKEGK